MLANKQVEGGVIPHPDTVVSGAIEFDGVSFSYPGDDRGARSMLIQNLNLSIPKGSMVALVGPSGAGKSTLLSLLERFYEPTVGRILLDGVDIRNLSPSWLRKHIGYVQQDVRLFRGSIADNVRYGKPEATDEEVEAAVRLADLESFTTSLPDGLSTLVGERGAATLSGGQQQRIGIARALLRDPLILLFDEATSSLDVASEANIYRELYKLKGEKTILVVAHRLSTIRDADFIVVFDGKGHIEAVGDHHSLLSLSPTYAKLVQGHIA